MLKTILFSVLFAVISCLLSGASPAQAQGKSFRIGVIYGFTGEASNWAAYGRMGLELARDDINAAGGINGKPLELVFEDSQTNPARGVSAYRKLVSVDKVRLIIGDLWSILTNPLIPLAERDQVILISPTVTDVSVEKPNPYFFSMGHRIDSLRAAVESFFKLNADVRSVGILCHDDAWGRSVSNLWKEAAQSAGVKVAEEICQNNYTAEFTPDLIRLAAKKVDAVLCPTHIAMVSRRMKELHFDAKILSTHITVESLALKLAGYESLDGTFFTDWEPEQAFVSRFVSRFGKHPIVEAHNHYETLRSIAKALEISDGDVLAVLRKVRYEGVAGPINFTSSQYPNLGEAKLFQVRDGKTVRAR